MLNLIASVSLIGIGVFAVIALGIFAPPLKRPARTATTTPSGFATNTAGSPAGTLSATKWASTTGAAPAAGRLCWKGLLTWLLTTSDCEHPG